MSPDKKMWTTPRVRPIDVHRVRALVEELVEKNGQAPEALKQLRTALDEIEAQRAE